MQALKKPPSSEVPNGGGAPRSNSLGDGFLKQKQQALITVSEAPGVVATTTVGLVTTTTTVETTTVATVATVETVATVATNILPPSTTATAIPEDALSVETISVELERRLGALAKASKVRNPYCKANNETRSYSAPAQVVAFFGYLLSLLPSKTEASERATLTNEKLSFYKRFFPPGTMSFDLPKGDRTRPSDPDYAVIEGVRVHLIRWELNFPGLFLPCCFCDEGELVPERWDFLKNKKLTPVFDVSGRTEWVAAMRYKCKCCKKLVAANDGNLMRKLPYHVRACYPVDCRYARPGKFHLSLATSRLLEKLLVTDGSGELVSRLIYEQRAQQYEDVELAYYSSHASHSSSHTTKTRLLPSFEDWAGQYGPSGEHLREVYELASRSSLTDTGVSDYDRHRREIQSVVCDTSISVDHTFQALKNYPTSIRDKTEALFGISVETGEVACAVVVPTTAIKEAAHAVEQFLRRKNVKPKVISTDTWPSNTKFWKILLGDEVVGRLGLWHFINRIYRTLRETHPDFGKAISVLQASIYRIDELDEAAVMQALFDGTLNGTKMSWEDINQLRGTARWNRNYSKYLKKILFPLTVMIANLDRWFVTFKVNASEGKAPGQGRLNPENGQTLFTPETKVAFEEAKKKAEYIMDVLSLEEIYQPVEAPTRAKHSLPTYRCARATESKLESFHADQAMFGNTGMSIGLIDTINHSGLARHNTKIRWRLRIDLLSSAERDEIPFYFRRIVRHYDHSRLQLVNQMARSAGVEDDVHKDIRPLLEDNGERFYGDYYLELLERVKTIPATPDDRCQCGACSGSTMPLPFQMVMKLPPQSVLPTAASTRTMSNDLPATNATRNGATKTTATAGVLLPTAPKVVPPGLFVHARPQQYPPVCFLAHPLYYAPYQPYQLPHPFQLLAQQAARPVVVSSSRPRKRKHQGEYHCCKKYWMYHVVDKQEGKMGAPPHCLDCPVRKQRRHPNRGPKGPH
jgi:hypothetical protein